MFILYKRTVYSVRMSKDHLNAWFTLNLVVDEARRVRGWFTGLYNNNIIYLGLQELKVLKVRTLLILGQDVDKSILYLQNA